MRCRICHKGTDQREYIVREMLLGTRHKFIYFQCSTCGCLQLKNIPNDIESYYPLEYFQLFQKMVNDLGIENKWNIPSWASIMAPEVLDDIMNVIFGEQPDKMNDWQNIVTTNMLRYYFPTSSLMHDLRILDIGCGNGRLLGNLGRLGYKNCTGVDRYIPHNSQIVGKNIRFIRGTISDVTGEYDLVMFHHSFEHFENPHETMLAITRLLAPRGMCLIRVPIIPSYAWNRYGTNWMLLDAPRHIFIHSLQSMKILAESANLTISHIIYDSTPLQIWASEQYEHDISFFDYRSAAVDLERSMFSLPYIKKCIMKAKELNRCKQGDQAAFYLCK